MFSDHVCHLRGILFALATISIAPAVLEIINFLMASNPSFATKDGFLVTKRGRTCLYVARGGWNPSGPNSPPAWPAHASTDGPIQPKGSKIGIYFNMPLCSTSEVTACSKIKPTPPTRSGMAQLFSDHVCHLMGILFALVTISIAPAVLEIIIFLMASNPSFATKDGFW